MAEFQQIYRLDLFSRPPVCKICLNLPYFCPLLWGPRKTKTVSVSELKLAKKLSSSEVDVQSNQAGLLRWPADFSGHWRTQCWVLAVQRKCKAISWGQPWPPEEGILPLFHFFSNLHQFSDVTVLCSHLLTEKTLTISEVQGRELLVALP